MFSTSPARLRALAIIGATAVVLMVVVASACSDDNGYSPTPTPQASPTVSRSSRAATSPTPGDVSTKPDTAYVDALNKAASSLPLDLASGNKLGKDDAPLKMLTFVDFQCPYCLKFAAVQEPALIDEYVKTGKLQIIVQPYPILGPESVQAAIAGECAAAQDRFWPYYDHLYLIQAQAGQVSNERGNVGRFSPDHLVSYANDLGLDSAVFTSCLDDPATLSSVQDAVETARKFGITATPGFVINGVSHGSGTPATMDAWRQLLDGLLNAPPTSTSAGSL
jgi:protein-disulfide isomerase